jgi:uncharacterized protein
MKLRLNNSNIKNDNQKFKQNKVMKKFLYLFIVFSISTNAYSQKDRLDDIAINQGWNENFLGTTKEHTLNSEYVDEKYDISIYLPPSYFDSDKKFPVLILTDAFHGFGIAKNTADLLIFGKELPEIIIVGIGFKAKNTVEYVKKRARDFTTVSVEGFSTFGGAKNFYEFLKHELFPFLEKNYRIDLNDKALSGFSFGGQFATFVLLEHTSDFNRYIIGSPSIWWDENLINIAKDKIEEIKNNNLIVYTFMGENEGAVVNLWKEINEIYENNKNENLKFKQSLVKGKTHTGVFQAEFSTGLEWIYKEKNE